MTLFKTKIHRGWPILRFGYGGMYTNKRTKIDKVWYVFGYPIILASYVPDDDRPYRQFVIDTINNHPEMRIVKEYFNDRGEDVKEDGNGVYKMYSVYAENDHGVFYVGNIGDAYRMRRYTKFRTSRPTESRGVASVGYDAEKDRWCGWSHRATACFSNGDKIFDPMFGDDKTLFTKHGEKTIETEGDAIEAASRFANYVS
jgi:hypothetical protein